MSDTMYKLGNVVFHEGYDWIVAEVAPDRVKLERRARTSYADCFGIRDESRVVTTTVLRPTPPTA